MNSQINWQAIQEAYKIVTESSQVNKLEGKGWKVYRVGMIIRIDIG